MIDEKKTFELFGYYPTDLAPQSHKKVVAICEDCGKERIIQKGQYRECCFICSKKGKRNPMYGKKHTLGSKYKMSENRKGLASGIDHPFYGKYRSKETKKKISENTKKAMAREEVRKKMTGKNHPFYGKHHSDETKRKLSESLCGRVFTEEQKRKMSASKKGKYTCEKSPRWIDGKSKERSRAKRRSMPKPEFYLNSREYPGMYAHHLTQRVIIYVPKFIHKQIKHNSWTYDGMYELNYYIFNYLLEGI